MAENHLSTRPLIARKPCRYQVDQDLDVLFLRQANSAHVSQTLWRDLTSGGEQEGSDWRAEYAYALGLQTFRWTSRR